MPIASSVLDLIADTPIVKARGLDAGDPRPLALRPLGKAALRQRAPVVAMVAATRSSVR